MIYQSSYYRIQLEPYVNLYVFINQCILILILHNKKMSTKIVGEQYDCLLKLVVIGDSSVGKTNLLSRFATNDFSYQSKPTIGVQFATKTVNLQNKRVKVQIWDTAGQQRFRAITQAYYKGASGALIVFDLTRRSTYDNLTKWIKQLKDNSEINLVSILVGNKCDLVKQRAVKQDEVSELAHENKLFYLQTSALTSDNVDNAFNTVIKQILMNQNKRLLSLNMKPTLNNNGITSNTLVRDDTKIVLNSQRQKRKKKQCCE